MVDPAVVGPGIAGGRAAHEFTQWLWVQWRDEEDLKDTIRRTLCVAICEDDPEAAEVKELAAAIERRMWGVKPKKGFVLFRPAKASIRFAARKWSRKSKGDALTWPGWRQNLQELVLASATEVGLPAPPSNGRCRSWPSDAATLAKRAPESLIRELWNPRHANTTRKGLLAQLKESDETEEHFEKRSQLRRRSKFEVSATGLVAIAAAVVAISQLPELPHVALTVAALIGIGALVIAVTGGVVANARRTDRTRRYKALNRDFSAGWAARYLAATTGEPYKPEPEQLTLALQRAFQATAHGPHPDGGVRVLRDDVQRNVFACLERDLKERLLPRAADLGDDELTAALLRLEDALICRNGDDASGRVLDALAALIAVIADGNQRSAPQ